MKHNLENPHCPDCGSISAKAGVIPTRNGKITRYLCRECGRAFSDNTLTVKIQDITQYKKDSS